MKCLILAIVVIFCVAGCSESTLDPRIAKAASVVDDFPDSAMSCLLEIDQDRLHNRQDKAAYSLIYTLASLKLGIDTLDMTALNPAWDFYAYQDKQSKEKMLVHFAKAAMLSKADYNIEALAEYENAIKYAYGKNADRYIALSYFNMSSIYNGAYSYPDVRESVDKGKQYMLVANDTSIMMHGYLVSGMSYNSGEEHEKALEELENGLNLAIKRRDKEMADRIRLQIAYTQSMLDNHTVATEMFDSLFQSSDCPFPAVELYSYINSLSYSGDTERAECILNSLDSAFVASTTPHWLFSRCVISSEKGNFREAYQLLNGTMNYQNSLVNDKLSSNLVREQKELAITNENMQTRLAENRKKLLVLVFCLAAMAVAGAIILIIFIIKRNKMKSVEAKYLYGLQLAEMKSRITELTVKGREMERANAVISDNLTKVKDLLAENEEERLSLKDEREILKRDIEEYNQQVSMLRKKLISNFRQIHHDVSQFCNNMPTGISTPSAIKVYEVQRREMLSKYRDESILALLEEQVNELMNQILSHLRDTGLFSEEELKILTYEFCGFNYHSMADILNITHNNMAVKRNRLKNKINQNVSNNDLSILKMNTNMWSTMSR